MTAILNAVAVTNGARIVTATVGGVRYEIPEAWLMGACQFRSINDALHVWHEQAEAEKAVAVETIPLAVSASLIGNTLRRFSAAGPCLSYEYGVIVKYTDKSVTFRTDKGEIKRAGGYQWHSNGTRELGKGLLHAGPCPSCMDHPRTQYPDGYMD